MSSNTELMDARCDPKQQSLKMTKSESNNLIKSKELEKIKEDNKNLKNKIINKEIVNEDILNLKEDDFLKLN